MPKEKFNKTNIVHGIITLFVGLILLMCIIMELISPTKDKTSISFEYYLTYTILSIIYLYLMYVSFQVYKNNRNNFLKYSSIAAIILMAVDMILNILNLVFFKVTLSDNAIINYAWNIIDLALIITLLLNLKYLFKNFTEIRPKKIFIWSAWLIGIAIIGSIMGVISITQSNLTLKIVYNIGLWLFAISGFFGIIALIGATSLYVYRKYSKKK